MTTPAATTPTPAVPFAETVTPAVGEEWVVRKGKIFEVGSWEDKKFSMTAEELAAAARDFVPVPIDLEHIPSVLDGKLGNLFEVEVKGPALYGTTRLPKWFDEQLGDEGRKVSCYWDRETKRLKKLSVVRSPRITDAALFAAFAAGDRTWDGMRAIQEAHDQLARAGAVCSADNSRKPGRPMPYFHSGGELEAIQKAHDALVAGGAKCNVIPAEQAAEFASPRKQSEDASRLMQIVHDRLAQFDPDVCDPSWAPAGFSAAAFADWPKQVKAMKAMHTLAVEHGATCPGAAAMSATTPKGETMTKRDELLKALFGDKPPEGAALAISEEQAGAAFAAIQPKEPDPAEAARAAFAASPEYSAMQKQIADLKAENERREAKLRADRTAAFAREAVTKMEPHRARTLTATYARALEDDATAPTTVSFSRDGKDVQGSRAEALETWVAGLPDSAFTREVLAPGSGLSEGLEAVFHRAENPSDSDDEIRKQNDRYLGRPAASRAN